MSNLKQTKRLYLMVSVMSSLCLTHFASATESFKATGSAQSKDGGSELEFIRKKDLKKYSLEGNPELRLALQESSSGLSVKIAGNKEGDTIFVKEFEILSNSDRSLASQQKEIKKRDLFHESLRLRRQ